MYIADRLLLRCILVPGWIIVDRFPLFTRFGETLDRIFFIKKTHGWHWNQAMSRLETDEIKSLGPKNPILLKGILPNPPPSLPPKKRYPLTRRRGLTRGVINLTFSFIMAFCPTFISSGVQLRGGGVGKDLYHYLTEILLGCMVQTWD